MKKIISVALLLIFVFTLAFSMTSCGDDGEEPITPNDPNRVNGDDDILDWNDPSLNPEGGTQFRPVQLPSGS